jgi:hypothetical protein
MIRAALNTTKGPIGIIGINQENFMRMKAGMPLNINLQEITPKGARMNRVIIHYADTYEQVVDDLIEKLRPAAKEMDARIKKEQEERG